MNTRLACLTLLAGSVAGSIAGSIAAADPPRYQQEPSVVCSTANTTVRLSSPSIARTAGFEYEQVEAAPLTRAVTRNAEVVYDANRYARIASRAPGVVVKMHKDLGETVRAGEPLATVDSADLGTAKADLLQAQELLVLWENNAEREAALWDRGAGTERDAREAQTRLAEARIAVSRAEQRLRNLGLNDGQIEQVVRENDTTSLLAVTAPFDGVVVERSATMGEVIDARTALASVADTGRMWAMIDLTPADLATVQPGQSVTLATDGVRGRTVMGTLTWISTAVDPATRTIKARAEFDNADGRLRANLFGQATVQAGEDRAAVTVPKDAVQWEGCCNVAFVKADEAGTTFQPKRLTLGFDAGDHYEVLDGLAAGDTIVTRGSFILKNEIRKDAVGAGCCEVDHLAE